MTYDTPHPRPVTQATVDTLRSYAIDARQRGEFDSAAVFDSVAELCARCVGELFPTYLYPCAFRSDHARTEER